MEAEIKRLLPRALNRRPEKASRVDEQTLLYPFDEELAWFLAHYPRTPSRILWDLYSAEAERLEPLYEELIEWLEGETRPVFWDGATISVRARDVRIFPASGSQIQGTVKNALIAGALDKGMRVRLVEEDGDPDLLFSVRGTGGPLVLSIDLSGRNMSERGYRTESVEAPVKETTAAQLLLLARWDPRQEALVDPMCGSGTIAIEAALSARAAPVWIPPRAPMLDRLPQWKAYADRARPPLFADSAPLIFASDLDPSAVDTTRRNCRRAGLEHDLVLNHGDFRDFGRERLRRAAQSASRAPSLDRGLIITNPPFGERMQAADLLELYAALRDYCKSFGHGWRAAFIAGHLDFESVFGLRPTLKKPLPSAQLKSYAYVYDL